MCGAGGLLALVVGGWYGMASVKWLTRIVVTTKPFQGFFQSLDYSYFERTHGEPTLVPVTKIQIKSSIGTPAVGDVVPTGKKTTVTGWAWAGEARESAAAVSARRGVTTARIRFIERTSGRWPRQAADGNLFLQRTKVIRPYSYQRVPH